MKHSIFVCISMLLIYTASNAGTLANDTWLPSECGEKPVAPSIDASSVDGFNLSLEIVSPKSPVFIKVSCLLEVITKVIPLHKACPKHSM